MVRKLSQRATQRLLSKKIIEEGDTEIYQYGLEQLLTSIIDLLTLLFIGQITGMLLQGIVFVLSFMLLRKYAGGYHATSPLKCFLLTNLVILGALSVMKYFRMSIFVYLGFFFASSIIVFIFSPVESKNKGLDEIEKNIYRRKTLLTWFIELLLLILMLIANCLGFAKCIIMGVAMVGVSQLLGYIEIKLSNEETD